MDLQFSNDQTFILTLAITGWSNLYNLASCTFRAQIRSVEDPNTIIYSFSSDPDDNYFGTIDYFTSISAAEVVTIVTPGGGTSHSYAPAEVVTLAGGTQTSRTQLKIETTEVESATIGAAGSGGTPGTQTVVGTTGEGTPFQASVTVSGGGVITAVLSITVKGAYTANPDVLALEPVTGGGLTGAALNLIMGVASASIKIGGLYTVPPTNPVAQLSSTGIGTGATFAMDYEPSALLLVSALDGDTKFIPGSFLWALQLIAPGPPVIRKNLTYGACVITQGVIR